LCREGESKRQKESQRKREGERERERERKREKETESDRETERVSEKEISRERESVSGVAVANVEIAILQAPLPEKALLSESGTLSPGQFGPQCAQRRV
jgi:hypothetical protein